MSVTARVLSFGSLFEVQPFDNVLMRITVRGTELRAYLERLARAPTDARVLSDKT